MRNFLLFVIGFSGIIPIAGFSQQVNNQRKKAIAPSLNDTITLDTLSILPQSFSLHTKKGQLIDSTYYTFEPLEGRLILNRAELKKQNITADTLYCTYRVFPFLFTQAHQHKDNNTVHPLKYGQQQGYVYQVDQNKGTDPFDLGTLNKSGSISRGITFGNSQSLAVNSALNLQLAGKLSNNVNIQVSATDNSLPIQPEGNTAQLQDFDKVFIRLYNKNTSLIAGDYELTSPSSYFMKFYKKAEGGLFSTKFLLGNEKDSNKADYMRVTGGGAISKGDFARDQITAIDGNLGPYLLTGPNNETYIVILSGTEKVYLDGQLMQRGQNNDYTIDYNAAQVTFTPKHLITQSTRIVVEFQYSDQNYVRSLIYGGVDYHHDNLNLRFNVYSEQDAKSQPLQQSLSPEQQQFLAGLGNNIQNALAPGIQDTVFNHVQVLYRKMDTVNAALNINDTIYVYSTDSTKAHYNLSFSEVNAGQGDYIQIASAANGRVFQWVAPVGGVHKGNYIPEILLITPKKKQMMTLGGDYKISAHSSITTEVAVTNNDVNTFSTIGKQSDVGFAGKVGFHNVTFLQDTVDRKSIEAWRLTTDLGYEGVQKDFSPIERYRPVEFARDWNRTSDSIFENQHIMNAGLTLNNKTDLFGYNFQAFLEGINYNATRQAAILKIKKKKLTVDFNGSLLNTKSLDNTSNYYKEFGVVSYQISQWIVGAGEGTENDIFRNRHTDSIVINSTSQFEQASTFKYYQWNAFFKSADTSKVSYGVNYQERTDFAPLNNQMTKSLYSKNLSFDLNLLKNPNSRFKANVTYHILTVFDSSIAQGQQPVNALVGQAQYDLKLLHGFVTSSTYYQAGSGLQPKETYTYVQVAQGQGVYMWTDYNHDGISELNEFTVAPFPDEADYIRVYTPTNQFIKTYTSGVTETFSVRPSAIWGSKKDIRSFISLFSEQLAFHTDRKTTSTNFTQAFDPLQQSTSDSSLVGLNTSLRNTIFFNQLNPKYGADYSFNNIISKTVLQETGEQSRQNQYSDLHARCNLTTKWMLEADQKFGYDISGSGYFSNDNFNITYYQTQPKLNFQPNTSFRVSSLFTYADKVNAPTLGGGSSVQQTYGTELKYNVLNKGSLLANFNYIHIAFDGESSSPLGFEMLQGLNAGNNYTWGVTYQCNISQNIQLNVSYTGRSSEGSNIVNTGSAQVRAFF